MTVAVLVSLILVALTLLYAWVRKRYSFFERNGFLHEKAVFPFGNMKGVGRTTHVAYRIKEYYDKFRGKAPAFGIYFFASDIVITDLDVVKDILVKDFPTFHNRGIYYNAKDDPLSAHLFAIDDGEWKSMRTKLTPTFSSGKMKMVFSTMLDISNLMIAQLKEEPNLDMIEMKDVLAKFTTDVIGNVAFGIEMNSIKDPESMFRKMGRKIFKQGINLQAKAFFMMGHVNLARKLRLKFFPSDVSEFFMNTIRETVDYRIKNNIQRNDVMNLLLKLKDNGEPEEGKISFNELAAECFVFFIAGFETSSSTSCFVLYALSLSQDVQKKLRNEIKTVLAKSTGEITYEGMQEMKYLQMVIDETQRMYGPVAHLLRTASSDYKIPNSDLVIPKGTVTIIPTYSIHMDAEIYPEPEKFDPERFTEGNKRDRHPFAHMPFGEGPRNCLGMRFGLMQTKIALIQLLMTFKFSPTTRTTIPMRFDPKSLVLSPHNEMWLKVEKL